MTTYAGIDPGKHGALAILWSNGVIEIFDTPVSEGKPPEYLVGTMADALLSPLSRNGDVFVSLEVPPVFAGTGGHVSQHTTAQQYRGIGLWEGMLAALGLPYAPVRPQDWRRVVGLPPAKAAGKGASRVLAQQLFPSVADQLARVKDDGRAEALLIAEWGRRRGRGEGG